MYPTIAGLHGSSSRSNFSLRLTLSVMGSGSQVFELEHHAAYPVLPEVRHVGRRRFALIRVEGAPQRSHVVPLQLAHQEVGIATADRDDVAADAVATQSGKSFGERDVHL